MAIDFVNFSFDVPSAGINVPAHLVFVSGGQIDAQLSWESQGQTAPGVVAVLDPNANVITSAGPAKRGAIVQLNANGLGPVNNQLASRDAVPLTTLSPTTRLPTVTIGGIPAQVVFSGLTPGLPDLYQLNVTVPSNIGAGVQPVVVSIAGAVSKGSNITVQ